MGRALAVADSIRVTVLSLARNLPFDQRLADKICEEIAKSPYGLRRIMREQPGLPTVSTIMLWLNDEANQSFREQYARATDLRAELLFDQCIDIADESENDKPRVSDHEDVHATEQVARSKLRVDTRKWMAGKLMPKKYGDRQFMDVKAEVGVSLGQALDKLSDD